MREDFTNEIVTESLNEAGILVEKPSEIRRRFDDLQFDSRKVTKKNTLFVVKGAFKIEYLTASLLDKISGIVTSRKEKIDIPNLPHWIVSNSQIALAVLSAEFFGHPEKKLKILGITGTKGKTSSTYMAYSLLDRLTNHQTAMFSTIDTFLGRGIKFKSELTTPESYELFSNMKKALDNGNKYLVMEVSSQSYLKNRVFGIHFKVGAFLNISPDHIGINEHPTFADYLAHKKMLAENSDVFVSNIDDAHGQEFIDHAKSFGAKTVSVSENKKADVNFHIKKADLDESIFYLTEKGNSQEFLLDIPGVFNIYNASVAIAMVREMGFKPEKAKKALAELQIPGRMVKIKTKSHGLIIVDYAHNGQAVTTLLTFLKSQHQGGKIIIVLGSPGDKGEDRRSQFGEVISKFVDVAYLTTDDPGTEDPHQINNQIRKAISNPDVELHEELDRSKAIQEAIKKANINDLVVLAAKGEDAFQKTNHVDVPYLGDKKVAEEFLAEIEKV
ncbi:UDP-N-acetylmuramyl-tripeptide synthetase [Oenococcus oeni]|uniref:Mur ligase family protein n=1 Tax=Oenococcus oeni TaxID=1247 RepID=UPI0010AF3BCD|nr:UDP-N-acetylmuramoyl-L-alanyl-D-glutamate--2,6-diaminopimelate ligase [Oenococcus oeni]SYW04074.1 UDP-N-acetylmuramyl-tripeptide synthetase [Oenococcus oeni]